MSARRTKPKGPEEGRVAQKRRTRKAIIAAATQLLAQGKTPSLNDVAAAADVSRRTVYMYFPTVDQLLIDAALGSMTRDTVDAAIESTAGSEDVRKRVEVMTRAVQRNFAATEQQGRTLMRLTVDAARGARPAGQPVRGYRRIEWIERALEPLAGKVDRKRLERLVSALAMVIGWESLIVARDIRALSLEQAEEVSAWAARVLVDATLAETPRRSRKTRPR
ncbi:MAG TPA: TetR/AcrR family transcriptional regulator, partial [Gemmatimonadaceae bacterium]|nr:TetR/AcrR family transcriptional regulator [Gemmatimonadaceae bacterium]